MGRGPVQGPQLGAEHLRPGQADADGPQAHGRVLLLGQLEVVGLLVGADIQGTDDHHAAAHGLQHLAVGLVLVLLGGIVIPAQVEELAAEQSDAVGVRPLDGLQVFGRADIGAHQHPVPVEGDGLPAPEGVQIAAVGRLLAPAVLQPGGGLGVRVHKYLAGGAVHKHMLAVKLLQQAVPKAHHRRNAHGAGEDGSVGVGGAPGRDEAQHLAPVQPGGLAGRQVVGGDDAGHVAPQRLILLAGEQADHPPGHVQHVGRPLLHIVVVHLGEHIGELGGGLVHRVLRVDVLVPNDPGDGVPVVQVLQHHLVNLEQEGFLLPQLGLGVHIELGQLDHGLAPGLVEPGNLGLRVGHLPARLGLGVPPEEAQLP